MDLRRKETSSTTDGLHDPGFNHQVSLLMCGPTGVDGGCLRRTFKCASSSRELHAVLRNRWVRHEAADVLLRGQGSACPRIHPRKDVLAPMRCSKECRPSRGPTFASWLDSGWNTFDNNRVLGRVNTPQCFFTCVFGIFVAWPCLTAFFSQCPSPSSAQLSLFSFLLVPSALCLRAISVFLSWSPRQQKLEAFVAHLSLFHTFLLHLHCNRAIVSTQTDVHFRA